MIRDQFKDVKKVTSKEVRKKAVMGERNYYVKQIGVLQDLNKSLGISLLITTPILGLAFVFALLMFIYTHGEEGGYETWRFVVWTCVFGVFFIFTLVWYIFIKPSNSKKIENYRHELERINAKSLSKAKGIYALYGEEYKKEQLKRHEEEKSRVEKEAAEKLKELNAETKEDENAQNTPENEG